MAAQIFINLPVKDLTRSVDFFTQLGYQFKPEFTDENASCMIVGDNIFVMLLEEKFFQTFTLKSICDTTQSTEVLLCLSCDSREQVNAMVSKAIAVGATSPKKPDDKGYRYAYGFEDLDGHSWELVYMEPKGNNQTFNP